jgi:hypothetical protein
VTHIVHAKILNELHVQFIDTQDFIETTLLEKNLETKEGDEEDTEDDDENAFLASTDG